MSPTVKSLGIDRLSREQRISLAQEIWDSVAVESTNALLTEGQRRELQCRVAEDDSTPDDVIPWEQVKAQAMARMKL